MSKIFTIFGATGQQGGALIKYLLHHPRFSKSYIIRGVTRNASKAGALKLKDQGVEVIEADLDDAASLRVATQNSYAIFAVTNYWEKVSAEIETAQGKAVADAAIHAKAELLTWSSLPRTGIAQFNSKADVEDYIRGLPIKSVFYMPGWFMQNFLVVMKPKMTGDGSYVMSKPWPTATSTSSIPLIDIEDTGKYIQPFLNDPKKYNHAILTASTAFYTPAEICETWTKVTGHEVKFDEAHDGVSYSGMTQDQKDAFVENSVVRESTYYGPGGREHLEWTLAQMEERPSTWESFVKRNEPWF